MAWQIRFAIVCVFPVPGGPWTTRPSAFEIRRTISTWSLLNCFGKNTSPKPTSGSAAPSPPFDPPMTVLSGSHPSAPTVCDGSVTRRSATPLMEVFSSWALRRRRSMSCSTTCCERGRAKRTQPSVMVRCSGSRLGRGLERRNVLGVGIKARGRGRQDGLESLARERGNALVLPRDLYLAPDEIGKTREPRAAEFFVRFQVEQRVGGGRPNADETAARVVELDLDPPFDQRPVESLPPFCQLAEPMPHMSSIELSAAPTSRS